MKHNYLKKGLIIFLHLFLCFPDACFADTYDPVTVKIFLLQGSPSSIRTAELSNWTGKAVAGPRSQVKEILKRKETDKPGVYFLTGVDSNTGRTKVYIGEAENLKSRIKEHLSRDFWETIIFFVSKDENLTKAHIRYLEGKLIETARAADRYELENVQSSGSRLPESAVADMDIFLLNLEKLLPILGENFLKPGVANELDVTKQDDLLYCQIKNLTAKGRQTDSGFVVFRGSEAVLKERPSAKFYKHALELRNSLLSKNIVVKQSDRIVFVKDYEFSSPSAAASVIYGGNANGRRAWKDAKGISLKQKEAQYIE